MGERMSAVSGSGIGNPVNTMAIMSRHKVRAEKKYGQNFLTDPSSLQGIVDAAEIDKDDIVLEIGPGLGSLTELLSQAAKTVFAVEIDEKMVEVLKDTLSEYDNIEVINADILKIDINEIIGEKRAGKKIKVVANLPYYITTPILLKILPMRDLIESITVLMQREVAERMEAAPGTKDYGALTLLTEYYTKPEIKLFIPPEAFIPSPSVESAVIGLKMRSLPPVEVKDEEFLFDVIRASFNQRRKTLYNGLNNSSEINVPAERIKEAIVSLGLAETVRGETLSLEQFAALSDRLK